MITAETNEEWRKKNKDATDRFVEISTRFYQQMAAGPVHLSVINSLLAAFNAYVATMKKWNDGRSTTRDAWLLEQIDHVGLPLGTAVANHRTALVAMGGELQALIQAWQADSASVDADGNVTVSTFEYLPADTAALRTAMLAVRQTMVA